LGGGSTVGANGAITAPSYSIGGKSYTDVGSALSALDTNSTNITELQNTVATNQLAANAGIAAAMSATGLRYDERPGRLTTAAAVSYYEGQTGFAAGIGGTSNDGHWRINAAGTFSPSNTSVGGGFVGGLSYSW
jgi:autotransporter adhesin